MKKLLLIVFMLFALKQVGFAQSALTTGNMKDYYNPLGLLYIIQLNHGKTIQTENLILGANTVNSLKNISRVETIEKYGTITRAGAMLVKANQNVKFLILNQILDKFNIKEENRNAPICIDGKTVDRPETIVADETTLLDIKLIDVSNIKIINIITKHTGNLKPQLRSAIQVSNHEYPNYSYYLKGIEATSIANFLNNTK